MLNVRQAIKKAENHYKKVCNLSDSHTFTVEETEFKEGHWYITLKNSGSIKVFKIVSNGNADEGDIVYMKMRECYEAGK